MAMNSMRPQDHEGISSLDKDPHLLANRANENEQATIVNVEADYLPLYHAALKGDWERASNFMCCCPSAVTAKISNVRSMTALHVAARAGKSEFVKKLVAHVNMTQEALKSQDSSGRTALHYAAMSAKTVDAVKAIVNKNPALTQVRDKNGWTPLLCAASWGDKKVVRYLCNITTDCLPASPFTGPLAALLICTVTRAGFHDIAKDLVLRFPNLATASTPDGNYSVLRVLAEMPSAFRSGSRLGFWGWLTHKCDVSVRDEMGFPRENSRDCVERPISIAFKRILFRMIKMLVPVYGLAHLGTNILHVVAKLPPVSRLKSVEGSALQMQSEFLWFEDVKEIVHPSSQEERNKKKQTAWEAFQEQHKDLAKDGQEWMKEKSNSCTVVAALVITVVFAAAFTVPGGFNSGDGTPIFLKRRSFIVFAICDAIALFCSSCSIIMCLCILASRTTIKDFKYSLFPTLANAIIYLFLAITAMLFAFGSALWITLDGRLKLVPVAVTLLCLGPIIIFTLSQLPLFKHVLYSHYAMAAMIASGLGLEPPKLKKFRRRI